MSEFSCWMWENQKDARRVVAMLEFAVEVMEDLYCYDCADEVKNKLNEAGSLLSAEINKENKQEK